ncbi:MAG: ABC transporter ATP-binding protein [Clostridia bacterium]
MRRLNRKISVVRLLGDYGNYLPKVAFLVLLMILSGLLKSQASMGLGKLIHSSMLGDGQMALREGAMVLGLYALDALRLIVFNVQSARSVESMFLDIKQRLFNAMSRMDVTADAFTSGDFVSRVVSELPVLGRRVGDTFTWLASVYIRGGIALIFCMTISWQLSLLYVALLPLVIFLMKKLGATLEQRQKKAAEHSSMAATFLEEVIRGNHVVKAFRAQRAMMRRFGNEVDEHERQLNASRRSEAAMELASYLVEILLVSILFLCGGYLISIGVHTVGEFVAFVSLSGSIREAFSQIDMGVSKWKETNVLVGRLYEVLDIPATQVQDGAERSAEEMEAAVSVRNLSYSYGDGGNALRDVTLTVPHGRHVVIVGASGCGKSTLMRIICGNMGGFQGRITVLGGPMDDAARKKIALVSQDPCLFRGSIAENLRYARADAPEDLMVSALRRVKLWNWIYALREGMDAEIGDDASLLSGG